MRGLDGRLAKLETALAPKELGFLDYHAVIYSNNGVDMDALIKLPLPKKGSDLWIFYRDLARKLVKKGVGSFTYESDAELAWLKKVHDTALAYGREHYTFWYDGEEGFSDDDY